MFHDPIREHSNALGEAPQVTDSGRGSGAGRHGGARDGGARVYAGRALNIHAFVKFNGFLVNLATTELTSETTRTNITLRAVRRQL